MARPGKPIFDGKKAQGAVRNPKGILIIDCMSVGWAAYHGITAKLTGNEQRTEIIYGFLESLLSYYKMFGTRKIAFMFDSRHSYRKKKYPWYKRRKLSLKEQEMVGTLSYEKQLEKNEKEREAIFQQFGELRSFVLPSMGFTNIVMQRGIESDDTIASAVMNNPGKHTVVTADEDFYQLFDYCCIWSHKKKKLFTDSWFRETYGIEPKQWVDVKRLGGCTSDKVPGIPGVGEKTAIAFIKNELKAGKKLDGIRADMAKSVSESAYGRNQYLVELPIPETRVVTLSFDGQNLSEEGFGEVCSAYAFRFLERSTRNDWLALLKS